MNRMNATYARRCRTALAALALCLPAAAGRGPATADGAAAPCPTELTAANEAADSAWTGYDLSAYCEMDEVTHVQLQEGTLKFIPGAGEKVKSVTLLTTTARKPKKAFEKMRTALANDTNYASLGSTRNENSALYTYTHGEGERFDEVLCFIEGDGFYVVLQVLGELAEEDIAGLVKTFV